MLTICELTGTKTLFKEFILCIAVEYVAYPRVDTYICAYTLSHMHTHIQAHTHLYLSFDF